MRTVNEIACDPVRIGMRLRELRVANGRTQAEVAEMSCSGWDARTVSRLELGANGQSLRSLRVYMDALGLDLRRLFDV